MRIINPERPLVLGTLYNRKETSGYYSPGNDWKVIQTRSGTKILLNDAQGSIRIEDPSGNSWFMDGEGNISVQAPKNFTVQAGEDIVLSAGENIISQAGINISQVANGNYQVAASNISEVADEDFMSQGNSIDRIAVQDMNSISNNGEINHYAEKEIKNNSGEKTNNF